MKYDDLIVLVREVVLEARGTQDKRLRAFTNNITRNIMAIYSKRKPSLPYSFVSVEDLIGDLNTSTDEIYEIHAGAFPLALDPKTIDIEIYEDGVDPFISVILEIDRNSKEFNVSATDKNIVGSTDLGIHIAIETPRDFSKSNLKTLRDEIANSVRHELEHITQGDRSDQPASAYGRGEKYYEFINSPKDVDSYHAKYFLKPEEIPSHVRGYAQNAKNLETLKLDIESLLDNYKIKDLISKEEEEIILNTWLDWAKNNINRKGY